MIANLANVLHLVHILIVEFANVAESVAAGQDFDEGAEVLDGCHLAIVDLANFHLLRQRFDLGLGSLGAFSFGMGDKYRAVVVDVDLESP